LCVMMSSTTYLLDLQQGRPRTTNLQTFGCDIYVGNKKTEMITRRLLQCHHVSSKRIMLNLIPHCISKRAPLG
jgi:hypothetical protein